MERNTGSLLSLAYRHGLRQETCHNGKGLAAPRGALSYPRLSREELGGRFLGLMAYLDPKR